MKAEIITIGDELLIGQTIDTNSSWIGAALSSLGFDIHRKTSVHDIRQDILGVLSEASGRSDVVLITGGLGPTSDDITKQTLCEFFNTTLVTDTKVLEMIESMVARRGYTVNENNRRQADVPESCTVLANAAGTAPGMWFETDGTIFISMPGVPSEMKYIMETHVVPALRSRFTSQAVIHKNIMTYGLPEAALAEKMKEFEAALPDFIKLAYLPSSGLIKLRLTATGTDSDFLSDNIAEQVKKLYALIPELIYGEDEETLEIVVGRLLRMKGKSLSTAESCTGGNIAHLITSVPGSSDYFKGSVIAYSNEIKSALLGVDNILIERDGAVSESVAISMAEGVRRTLKTDYSVATTGIAGPGGATEYKPVGTIWVAVASDSGTVAEKHTFTTDRKSNITRFTLVALNMLRKQIIIH